MPLFSYFLVIVGVIVGSLLGQQLRKLTGAKPADPPS